MFMIQASKFESMKNLGFLFTRANRSFSQYINLILKEHIKNAQNTE